MLKKIILTVACASALSVMSLQATTLRIQNCGDPRSFDPHKISGVWENDIIRNVFDNLVVLSPTGKIEMAIAQSYTISDDGLVYTFKIRPGLKWSDGTPLSAKDVEYSFKRILDPKTASQYAWMHYAVKGGQEFTEGKGSRDDVGIKAVDDLILVITLKESTPYYLDSLGNAVTGAVVPQHAIEKFGDENWVRTENIVVSGAYKPVEWVPGAHVKAVKNDKWYAVDTLKIDDVIFYALEDYTAVLRSFEAGEADWTRCYPADHFQRLQKEKPAVVKYIKPIAGVYYYLFNQTKDKFKDPEVRKALSMAINREVIANQIVGTGEKPAYSWLLPTLNNYGDYIQKPSKIRWQDMPYQQRQAEAKKILESKGYTKDKPLTLTLRYNTSERHKVVAVAIAGMWKQIGVKAELANTEIKVHYSALETADFEVARAGWIADYNDPMAFLVLLGTGNGHNYGRYGNARYDELIKKASLEVDLTKRAQLMDEANQFAMDDSAAAPIYYYVNQDLVSPKLKGYDSNPLDIHYIRWMSLEK